MARHRKVTPGARSTSGPSRVMKVQIRVSRRPSDGGRYSTPYAFEACVRMRGVKENCGWGRNPRQAVSRAMKATGKSLSKRRGAFRGMR